MLAGSDFTNASFWQPGGVDSFPSVQFRGHGAGAPWGISCFRFWFRTSSMPSEGQAFASGVGWKGISHTSQADRRRGRFARGSRIVDEAALALEGIDSSFLQ